MRVLLISANTEQINILPLPLGLNCVAVATRSAGHDVELVDLMTEEDTQRCVKEAIEGFRPNIIGMSVRNIDDQEMTNPRFLLDQIKGMVTDCKSLSGAPIIIGGAGYSIFPEACLTYLGADMGIQGEGETVFPILLDLMQRRADFSGMPGLYLPSRGLQRKRKFVKDLDALPLPDARLWYRSVPKGQELWMPFQTRRGCFMNCSYCSTATIEGHAIRKRSPQSAVEGIARHVEAGFECFYFVDNVFNIPSSYASELCRRLITNELKVSWRCILYPAKVDEELIKEMARAGCKEVSLGFESGCERILRSMNKKYNPDEVRETSEMLAHCGIRQRGFLLLGGPGETRESVEESIAFADSLHLDGLKITVGIRIYPHTALAKTAVAEGVISPGDDLLFPKFYVVRGLEDWLHESVKTWMAERPNWSI
ncbi:MAG: radical SAM protein [Proteobacteria bacterium]|nr:radical SAM protein [Pseudomonadota bacterium]